MKKEKKLMKFLSLDFRPKDFLSMHRNVVIKMFTHHICNIAETETTE